MENISIYLKKFENLKCSDTEIKKTLAEVIKDLLKKDIDLQKISINGSKIFIEESGPIKSELFLYKNKIKERLEEKLERRLDVL